jgi:phage-related protein
MADPIDPVVATIIGDNSGLAATIADSQGMMSGFAASAPAMQFGPETAAGLTDAAAGAEELGAAETAATMSAEELAAAISEPMAVSAEDLTRTAYEAELLAGDIQELTAAAEELGASADQAAADLAAVTAELDKEAQTAEVTKEKVDGLGESFKGLVVTMGVVEGAAMLTGAGVLGLSAAVVGVGYLITDLGGNAQDAFTRIEDAFRNAAGVASQAFEPAINTIVGEFQGLAQHIEPDMQSLFTALVGPAESFGQGLADAIGHGMDALVPAIEQMEPLIASISADLGPLFVGVAGFVQDMSAAFEAGGGQQGLRQFAAEIGQLLPVLGELVGEIGAGLLPVVQVLTPMIEVFVDGLNAIGPGATTAIATAVLLAKGWSELNALSGTVINAYNAVASGVNWLTGALTGNAGAAASAATALTAEGAAADESAVGDAASAAAADVASVSLLDMAAAAASLVVEFLPLIAGVAAVALAGYELVEHWSDVTSFFSQVGGYITGGIEQMAGDVPGTIEGMISGITGIFPQAIQDMVNFGESMIQGLIQGIQEMEQAVLGPIEDLGHRISSTFGSVLGIFSPSRVFQEHGQMIGAGLALGITDSLGAVGAAGLQLASAAGGGFGSPGAGSPGAYAPPTQSGGGGQGAVQVYVTINIPSQPFSVASSTEIAQVVTSALQDSNLLNGVTMAAHSGVKGGAGR